MQERGFTLIELVVVIVVIGVLATVVNARVGGGDTFKVTGVRDQLASMARDAQRYARSSGCPSNFSIIGNAYSVTTTVPCGGGSQVVAGSGGPLSGNLPGGITATATSVSFDAHGAAAGGANIVVTSSSGPTASFSIMAGSGYVNLP